MIPKTPKNIEKTSKYYKNYVKKTYLLINALVKNSIGPVN